MSDKTSKSNRTKAIRYEPMLVAGVTWKDSTSYRQGCTDETDATAFETVVGGCRIIITIGHIYYPGQWIFHCFELGLKEMELPIGIDEQKAAELAYAVCKKKVDKLHEAFS